jgi:thiol:disulfide interchange protein DsbC
MRRLAFAALLAVSLPAMADEAAVRSMMQSKLRDGGQLESVHKTPFAGLYEVIIRGDEGASVYYVDEQASVVIVGRVFDAASGRDLTEERIRKLSAVDWKSLPLASAVTTRRGSGRRKIAIFSDPACPYCKRFENDLAKLDDITVYVFLYPVVNPESVARTKSVWCSKDRSKAWNDLMLRDIQPSAAPNCDNPVDNTVALGHKLGANSTPTWFVETGERYSGAMPLEAVTKLLDQASPPKR